MSGPVRITLRGHERLGETLLLIFAVDDGRGDVSASVAVDVAGHARFPHHLTDSGRSIGPVADAALLERAAQTVAVLEAAETWSWMRRRRRRPR